MKKSNGVNMGTDKPKGFVSWTIEHIRPSITLRPDYDYWDTHGAPSSASELTDYVKKYGTFWLSFKFRF